MFEQGLLSFVHNICAFKQVSTSGFKSLSLRKDGAILEHFQRHLTDNGSLEADAPESDAPEAALAPAPVGDAGDRAVDAADDDGSFWDDFRDFDDLIIISLIVIACLGAILCSGLGCACRTLCCGAPGKKNTGKPSSVASKSPSKDGSVSKGTESKSEALKSELATSGTVVTLVHPLAPWPLHIAFKATTIALHSCFIPALTYFDAEACTLSQSECIWQVLQVTCIAWYVLH